MFSLNIASLFIFISILAKVKSSLQISISERSVTFDGDDLFNASSDSLTRRDHTLSKRISFTIQLTPIAGAYVAPLLVDGQKFNAVFDTGSSDIVVPGADCSNCGNLPKYQPGANKPTGAAVTVPYVSGSVIGTPYIGKVSINNGMSYIQSEPIVSASSVPAIFVQNNVAGVIGMAVGPTSSTNSLPFYNALFKANAGLDPVFAFSLTNAAGSLTVGGDKLGQDVSSINKLTVTGDTHWTVGLGSVKLAGNAKNFASVTSILFDTGSGSIGAPTTDVFDLFQAIPDSSVHEADPSYYTVPCGTMPDISFTFSGDATPFVVPGRSLERAIPGDATDCQVLIKASPTLNAYKSWQLGTPFLKTVYSRFTVGTSKATSNFVGLVRV